MQCTNSTLYPVGGGTGFAVGDFVETNFDGIVREVAALDADTITIDPELDERPFRHFLIANWVAADDFTLDLRLAPESPGAAMTSGGDAIGSSIDIPAYQSGREEIRFRIANCGNKRQKNRL